MGLQAWAWNIAPIIYRGSKCRHRKDKFYTPNTTDAWIRLEKCGGSDWYVTPELLQAKGSKHCRYNPYCYDTTMDAGRISEPSGFYSHNVYRI